MVKEILIPKENKAQVEEVREIESEKETRLETPIVEKVEASVERSSSEEELGLSERKSLTDEDRRNKKNTEETIGGVLTASCSNPVAGTAAIGVTGALGGALGLVGEAFDNDDLKVAGDMYKESTKKPAENVGRAVKGIGEGIKKIFE